MSKYRGPRLRLVRKLGELPGLTNKISNKVNTPGQHGKPKRKVLNSQKLSISNKSYFPLSMATVVPTVQEGRVNVIKGETRVILD